jgi:soluble cytochrome b562
VKRFAWRHASAAAFILAMFGGGCSAEQLAREEAAAHAALTKLERAVDWASANPETVNSLLDDAAKASSDPGFQKAIDKAKAHVAAGDLQKAKSAVEFGAALTAPVSSGQ